MIDNSSPTNAALIRVSETCNRWRHYKIYFCASVVFAASRIVVLLGLQLGGLMSARDPTKWQAGPFWYHRLLRWDSQWYISIVNEGYRYTDDPSISSSTAFYPLYPLMVHGLKKISGLDTYLALLIVANVSAFAAILLLTKFVKDELGDEMALLSVKFFCFFPFSFFLSAAYSEPVFLVFALLSIMLLTRQQFILASIMAGLSLATRSTGVVLLPLILWEMVRTNVLPWYGLLPRMALAGLLAASGLLAFMGYLSIEFDRPFAFVTAQASWHDGTSLLDRFVSAMTLAPFWSGGGIPEKVWFACFLALTIYSFRFLRSAISLFGLSIIALPYFSLGITGSTGRFLLICIPAFMCLANLCKGMRFLPALIFASALSLAIATARYSQWHWMG